MKNILNAIILLAVAVLFYLHFSKESSESNDAKPGSAALIPVDENITTPTTPLLAGKFAYINTDTVFEKYFLVKDIRDDMAAEKLKMESQYSHRIKSLEKEVTEFQEKARYMTQQDGEKKQAELMEKEQSIMKMERELQMKFAELEMNKNKAIQDSVNNYLREFNKSKGYSFIFGFNGAGSVLYADSLHDITEKVLEGLNAMYSQNKRKL